MYMYLYTVYIHVHVVDTLVWKTSSDPFLEEFESSAMAIWGYSPLHNNTCTCTCTIIVKLTNYKYNNNQWNL